MSQQQRNIASDWGIDDPNQVSYAPTLPSQSQYLTKMRLMSNTRSYSQHSNSFSVSLSSIQSPRLDDYSNTSESLDFNYDDNDKESPGRIDRDDYRDFLQEYDDDFNGRDDADIVQHQHLLKILHHANNLLHSDTRQILDQFNYTIITSELMTTEKKLKTLKTSPPSLAPPHVIIQNKRTSIVPKISKNIFKLVYKRRLSGILLMISMIRYQLLHGPGQVITRLLASVVKFYSAGYLDTCINLLGLMMKSLATFIEISFQIDNKLVHVSQLIIEDSDIQRDISTQIGTGGRSTKDWSLADHASYFNGLSLIVVNYNKMIKKLLPVLDILSLWKYLNVYQLNDDSREMDYIWTLNNVKYTSSQKQYATNMNDLISEFVFVRKFYLCCLLALGEEDDSILENEELVELEILKQSLESRFKIRIEHGYQYLGKFKKYQILTKSLREMNNVIEYINKQLTTPSNSNGNFEVDLNIRSNSSGMDKLISRMDKISTNLRYLRQKGLTNYDKQVAQDLQNLSKLYNNMHLQKNNLRLFSTPVELKRYSMPQTLSNSFNAQYHHRHQNSNSNSSRRSSNGLQFNLLNAVLEDSTVVSYDDNYIKTSSSSSNAGVKRNISGAEADETVVIHDLAPQANSSVISLFEHNMEDESGDEEINVLNQSDLKLKLNETLNRMYNSK